MAVGEHFLLNTTSYQSLSDTDANSNNGTT